MLHLLWLYTTSPLRSLWQQPTFRLVADDHTKSGPATVMAMASKTADGSEDSSLLSKLDELVPAPLAQFDAFPKLPETYKTHSESRGFLTLFVAFLAFLLILNDLGEFIWGWPDYEFGVDKMPSATLDINVDMVVNMPCQCECSFDFKHSVPPPPPFPSLVTDKVRVGSPSATYGRPRVSMSASQNF